MKRTLLLSVLAAALAGCGPDCSRFCSKMFECGLVQDRPACEQGCDEVAGDRAAYVACVIDPIHTCSDIKTGTHCRLPQ